MRAHDQMVKLTNSADGHTRESFKDSRRFVKDANLYHNPRKASPETIESAKATLEKINQLLKSTASSIKNTSSPEEAARQKQLVKSLASLASVANSAGRSINRVSPPASNTSQ